MGDLILDKYLESQLALAKQKCENKTKKDCVSQKSKAAADRISKKQQNNFTRKCPRELDNVISLHTSHKPGTSNDKGFDVDSEYLPSCDEEDEVLVLPSLPCLSRSKQNVKKIIDDGDTTHYNERVTEWRKNITVACSGKFSETISSADIQYVLNGNNNPEETHELQNGLCVPNYIWKQLYTYQRTGIKWLWELHQVQSGGLLGDEMGLGKTVQIIAFLAGLAKTNSGSWGGLGPSIVVAPATIIYQWVSHFHYWCPQLRVAVLHHSGSHIGNHNQLIRDLHSSHGILLITYAGIVKYCTDLLSRQWHYLILDEGHKIRNPETQVSKLVKKFQTPHKLLITGSPMQNSLQELWSLFDFMRPGLLGTYAAFMEHFAQPITQGGYANASDLQEATALEIAKALKNIITPYMLRRTKTELQEHIKLPEKNEQVLFCALTPEQRDLYVGYLMSGTVRGILDKETRFGDPLRARVLVALSTLRKMCNHPDLYLYEAQEELEQVDEETFGHWKRSGKMTVVNSLLKIWQKQGHRALIFSQSRAMLCILEQYLQTHYFKYLKMDGTVSVSQRQGLIKTFNENSQYLVFLATTRVGGLGVNLTGADRVIIYDPDWNPATDNQAKERAWRIGQERNVTVYRLLSAGTIEEKIYQRQIFKHLLSNRILIDPNQKNVLTTSTLQGLFTFDDPNCDGDTETATLFKHTKVHVVNKVKVKDSHRIHPSESAKEKLEAMRRMAKEISKRISNEAEKPQLQILEDPREKYKQKRQQLLNPLPIMKEPEINIIDDKVTNIPFENVLSEIDIINIHAKKNYEENLIMQVIQSKDKEIEEGEVSSNEEGERQVNVEINKTDKNSKDESPDIFQDVTKSVKGKHEHEQGKKKRKRKRDSMLEPEIENLVSVKKLKKKQSKEREKITDDDDYVLHKLFAKASVKSALHHDVVVGLAEKEKIHRLKEEASKKARHAVRAIKYSSK